MLQVVLRPGCVFAGPWENPHRGVVRGWRAVGLGSVTPGLLVVVTKVTQGSNGFTSPNQDSQWPCDQVSPAGSGKDIPATHSHTLCTQKPR